MSVFMALIENSESDPQFKDALRRANKSQLEEALRLLSEDEGNERKLGRLRAALKRLAVRRKRP